jgi:hypothetical protein
MEREVRRSGAAAYLTPAGKHDDLALALSLCVFECRRFGRTIERYRGRYFTAMSRT